MCQAGLKVEIRAFPEIFFVDVKQKIKHIKITTATSLEYRYISGSIQTVYINTQAIQLHIYKRIIMMRRGYALSMLLGASVAYAFAPPSHQPQRPPKIVQHSAARLYMNSNDNSVSDDDSNALNKWSRYAILSLNHKLMICFFYVLTHTTSNFLRF